MKTKRLAELGHRLAGLTRTGRTSIFIALVGLCALMSKVAAAPLTGMVAQWGTYVVPAVEPGTRFKAVSGGEEYTFLALATDGRVIAWGMNGYGAASVPPGLSDIVAISMSSFSLALRSDGTVAAWGEDDMGQLAIPPGLSNVVAISAGGSHSLVLKADGTVAAWSDNFANESTVPPGLSNVAAITALPFGSLAVKSDGTVFNVGRDTNVFGVSNVVAVAADFDYVADPPRAIMADGTVCELWSAMPVPELTNVASIAQGYGAWLALQRDGTVLDFWGPVIPVLTNASAVAAAAYGGVVLKNDGQIVEITPERSLLPPLWARVSEVSAVASGIDGTLALKPDGTVLFWKSYGHATVAASNAVAVAAGYDFQMVLNRDGTVSAWGDNFYGQCDVPPGLSNVVAIAGGGHHAVALKSDNSVAAWGEPAYPLASNVAPNIVAISAGYYHTLALYGNGFVYAWGDNFYGQCTTPYWLTDVKGIAAGGAHSLALKSDGTVVAWGYNNAGQTNVPPGLKNVVAIAANGNHSLALKSDGTIVAWGSNGYGESTVPSDLGPAIAISSGFYDSMAIVLPRKPSLAQHVADSAIVLSWPAVYSGFTLQSAPDPAAGPWSDCTTPVISAGGQLWVTNKLSSRSEFFRLKK